MAEPALVAVTDDRLDDVADLFATNATTRGCWCMWFILSAGERRAGWGTANRERFASMSAEEGIPVGVLAYADAHPVGWCATGPRSRYASAIGPRTKILAGRDPSEDDDVWLVPCFFVRQTHRRSGLTRRLLEAAVELAREHGATAVEGFPVADDADRLDGYLGRERVFADAGFACIARPSPRRAVMRLDLAR